MCTYNRDKERKLEKERERKKVRKKERDSYGQREMEEPLGFRKRKQ